MPSHSHNYIDAPHLYAERDTSYNTIICVNDSQSANQMTYTTSYTGSSQKHNNISPYISIYLYKRTS